jgi:hypothetical protein
MPSSEARLVTSGLKERTVAAAKPHIVATAYQPNNGDARVSFNFLQKNFPAPGPVNTAANRPGVIEKDRAACRQTARS